MEILVNNPELWNDADAARVVMQKKSALERVLNDFVDLERDAADLSDLYNMAVSENDMKTVADIEKSIIDLAHRVDDAKLVTLFSDPADKAGAFLFIQAGAGGTEAQDWASMLARMYVRWAERHGYVVDVIDEHPGDEAGIKSITLQIAGLRAYGWLKADAGVHRLVRISPFDSNARRHTSFASVDVWPDIDDDIVVDIADKDLRIDTYRASGAGGQHVNKTDSAIRITHIPTNIVVTCQTDRSQHKNRDMAMKMLRSKLYELEMKKRQEAEAASKEGQKKIEWGSQIRSYVLQPYQMVKDLRTGVESTDPDSVLDGDIDRFLISMLQNNVKTDSGMN